MPLSEREQRLLAEMERSLYQSDADDVTTVDVRGKVGYTAVVMGVLVAVVGLGVLVTGVALSLLVLGLIGFAVMFAGAMFAVAPPARFRTPSDPGTLLGGGDSPLR